MKSEFCQYLCDMQKIADGSNIIIEARHFDVLDYYFKAKKSAIEAFKDYCKFRSRIYALEEQELPTTKELKPLTEMDGNHFKEIFYAEGFSPALIKEKVAILNSLFGFHKLISEFGRFESHRLAVELGYDVEFTLSRQ